MMSVFDRTCGTLFYLYTCTDFTYSYSCFLTDSPALVSTIPRKYKKFRVCSHFTVIVDIHDRSSAIQLHYGSHLYVGDFPPYMCEEEIAKSSYIGVAVPVHITTQLGRSCARDPVWRPAGCARVPRASARTRATAPDTRHITTQSRTQGASHGSSTTTTFRRPRRHKATHRGFIITC